MKVYMLWEEGGERELPWLVAAIDEATVEECGWPPSYEDEKHKTPNGRVRRELLVEIPDQAVDKLFQIPTVKAKVVPPEEGE